MTADEVLGALQLAILVLMVLAAALIVVWTRQERRFSAARRNEIALVLVRQHDWACLTGPWPHADYCQPRPGEHLHARVALLAQCASFDLARVHGIAVDDPPESEHPHEPR